MSAIRCVYSEEPKFPATDQHPDAIRYQVGGKWVDAIGGAPTQADIDAVLNPSTALKTTPVDEIIADPAQLAALKAALAK